MQNLGGWDGLQYDDFEEMLDAYSADQYDTVRLNIHSSGGDVWIGSAIYNTLLGLDVPITADIPGLAASAATVVAMAADTIRIGASARFMIHNSWTLAMGNAAEMREAAELLEGIDSDIATIYADRTDMKKSEITAMMDAETWMNGEQAIENGFADALMPKAGGKKPQGEIQGSGNARHRGGCRKMVAG